MAKSVDAGDLKSPDRKVVPVRFRFRAPFLPQGCVLVQRIACGSGIFRQVGYSRLTALVKSVEFASRYWRADLLVVAQAVEKKRKNLRNGLAGCEGCCRMRGLG